MNGFGFGFSAALGTLLNSFPPSEDKLDYYAASILDDDLVPIVGTGGILKEFPCAEIAVNTQTLGPLSGVANGLNMTDANAIYEYYFETVFDAIPGTTTYVISNGATATTDIGFRVRTNGNVIYVAVADGSTYFETTLTNVMKVGLNQCLIRFNCPTKEIYLNINGTEQTSTHTCATTLLGVNTKSWFFGRSAQGKLQKPVYFRLKKDGTVIREYIFASGQANPTSGNGTYFYYDLTGSGLDVFRGFLPETTQSYVNPFKKGYNLYLSRGFDGVDKFIPFPVGVHGEKLLTGFNFIRKITETEIGRHLCNYIEMPNLAIFDTTNRTYWKASITSDPYYVGGTAGKERWFHMSWLTFAWIDAHIETAYADLVFVKNETVTNQYITETPIKIDDILLCKEAIYTSSKDAATGLSLPNVYFSQINNISTRKLYHSLGNKQVVLEGNLIKYSSDNGATFSAGFDVTTLFSLALLSECKILENGTIVLFSRSVHVYYSTDNGATFTACTILGADGNPYVYHTPVNASYPGYYWQMMNGYCEANGVTVVGNYCHSGGGACPVNLYYTLDGQTWQVFYTFGQNPNYTDDGTLNGGTGGTPIGNASNPLITRHIHGVNIGSDGKFYACTGDGGNSEMHFLQCTYDSGADTWTVTDLLDVNSRTWQRMRGIGVYENNGYLYWGSDGGGTFDFGGTTYQCWGIYKSLIADINDPSKHTLVQALLDPCYTFCNSGSVVIAGLMTIGKVYVSFDTGETWTEYTQPINFQVNINHGWYNTLLKYFVSWYRDIIGIE